MCYNSYKKYKTWQKALEPIKQELYFAAISRRVFLKVEQMIRDNTILKAKTNHIFVNWLCHNYAVRISMSIRRLISQGGSKQINFRNLLKEIEKSPEIVCIDNFVKSRRHLLKTPESSPWGYSKESLQQEAIRIFNEVLKDNTGTYLGKREVRCDLKEMWKSAQHIVEYTNEKFAHMGGYISEIQPTIKSANECLELLIKKWNKYSRLLDAPTDFSIPDDNILFCDWPDIFNFPWIIHKNKTKADDGI